MARIEVGFITAVALFAPGTSESRQREAMRPFVSPDDEGSFADEHVASFVSEFDFELQHLLRERKARIKSLRAEAGYAWPEYHKEWLRFGCNLMVDDHEVERAVALLLDPMFAGTYDARLEEAARGFVEGQLPPVFGDVSVTFHVAAVPGHG